MPGRIPREFIDDLLARIDIVDLVDSHVPLKKSGANFMARCPFHSEKTPSFSVNRNKQFFHCFGCGASGNAISFLMDFNHLDFVEAVEDLAAFLGLDVPREQGDKKNNYENPAKVNQCYHVLSSVALFYSKQFKKNPEAQKAVDYLKSRGLQGEVARGFLLGYAPDQWQTLESLFDRQALIDAGLLIQKEGGRLYDRFRGRIMFPIRDRRGRVVGFGGRVLNDSMPKYLNSPETTVFQKGQEVYGLYECLEKNNKPRRILVVEGYMDVITLHQYGIDYAVAVLGTAISTRHLDLLFRFTSELVFCFDGDSAGKQAAWRAVESILPSMRDGRQARFVLMPEGEDPDSLLRSNGVDKLLSMQQEAPPLSDYFFETLSGDQDLSNLEGRAALVRTAKTYIEKLPNGIYQEMMLGKLKSLAQINDLDIFENSARIASAKLNKSSPEHKKNSPARTAIILLLQNPRLAKIVEWQELDWDKLDSQGIKLFKEVLAIIMGSAKPSLASITEGFRGLPEEKFIKQLGFQATLIPEDGIEVEFSAAIRRMVKQGQEAKLEQLIAKEKSQGLNNEERRLFLEMLEKK